jgi:hypothetical protein
MAPAAVPSIYGRETDILRLAREIAIDLHDIETILKNHNLTPKDWDVIKDDPRFSALLKSEVEAWSAAGNTHERTKLKAGAVIEEWLVEANARLYDTGETLPAKTELVKTLAKIAGMGERASTEGNTSERFSVVINLGADQLSFEKTREVTPKVIDITPVET